MTLPTTSLSFSALQTEYGGSNPISLSEYYRGGTYVPSAQTGDYGTIPTSGAINIGVFRGTTKNNILDTQYVTVGEYSFVEPQYGYFEYYYGWDGSFISGSSINDGTSNIYSGNQIISLYWLWNNGGQSIILKIYGSNVNSGWTTMNIAGYTYNRADAYYDFVSVTNGGPYKTWAWQYGSTPNPFGTTAGAVKTVTWT